METIQNNSSLNGVCVKVIPYHHTCSFYVPRVCQPFSSKLKKEGRYKAFVYALGLFV
jgi:hypothetical protein